MNTNVPATKSNTYYTVSVHDSGHFAQDSYSKYAERWAMDNRGELNEPVYGYEQALDHIAELRNHQYDGKLIYKDKAFYINIITTVATKVEINSQKYPLFI